MLFLTDDNDFRGDSQDITIDVGGGLQTMPCSGTVLVAHA
jgi:hypothetical protein